MSGAANPSFKYVIPGTNIPIISRMDSFVNQFLRNRSHHTAINYRYSLQRFAEWLKDHKGAPSGVTLTVNQAVFYLITRPPYQANELVRHYRSFLVSKTKLKAHTINQRLQVLLSIVKEANVFGFCNLTLKVDLIPVDRENSPVVGPSVEDVKTLFKVAGAQTGIKAKRDYTMTRFAYQLCLRSAAITNLKIQDVDFEKKSLAFRTKGLRDPRVITIPDDLMQVLNDWIKVRGRWRGYLFPSVDKAHRYIGKLDNSAFRFAVREMAKKAKIRSKIGPNRLRHTSVSVAIIRAREQGLQIENVKDFTGHRDIRRLFWYQNRLKNYQSKISSLLGDDL